MANDVYQLQILGNEGHQPVENVIALENDGVTSGDPVADAQALLDDVQSQIETNYAAMQSADYILDGYKAKRVNNGGGPTIARPVSGVTGGLSDESNNSAVGPLAIFPYLAALGWRVGKIFLPGISLTGADGNILDPAVETAVNTFLTSIFPGFSDTNNWNFVVWSRQLSIPYTPVSAQISLKLGVQRRRLLPVL